MIEFKNVTLAYKKQVVLRNLSFVIKDQEQVFFLGKSGTGKSTIFQAFSNPQIIKSGTIEINGQNLQKLTPHKLKKLCQSYGIINQETLLIENESLYYNLKLFYPHYQNFLLRFLKILTKAQKQEVWQIIEKLELSDHLFSRVSNLSGGQKRRIEIALILIQKAQIILADEPTSSLDINNSLNIFKLLKSLKQTLLVNLHKLDLITNSSVRVIGLKNQQVMFDQPFNTLKKQEVQGLYD